MRCLLDWSHIWAAYSQELCRRWSCICSTCRFGMCQSEKLLLNSWLWLCADHTGEGKSIDLLFGSKTKAPLKKYLVTYGKSTLCSQCWLACSLAGGGCYQKEWTSRYSPVFCTGRWDCRHLPSSVPEQQKWAVTQRHRSCPGATVVKMYRALRHKPSDHLRKLVVVLKNRWPTNQVLHGAGT